MRTCIISTSSHSLLQVVLGEDIVRCGWFLGPFSQYLQREQQVSIGLGNPLIRFSLVEDPTTGRAHFLWTAHHDSYDEQSLRKTLIAVEAIYRNLPLPKSIPVQYLHPVRRRVNDSTDLCKGTPRPYFAVSLSARICYRCRSRPPA